MEKKVIAEISTDDKALCISMNGNGKLILTGLSMMIDALAEHMNSTPEIIWKYLQISSEIRKGKDETENGFVPIPFDEGV